MSTKDDEVLFELFGLKVRKNTVYTVQHRLDMGAPTGYVKAGSTKLPSDGVGDVFYCRWINMGQGRGVWDTGFYVNSPMYIGQEPDEVEELVAKLMKNVVEPYRTAVGNPKAFSQEDPDSIEHTAFFVEDGKPFRTNNPVDVLELYFALLTRHVVTDDFEKDATFDMAAYRVIDIDDRVSQEDEKASKEFEVVGEFQRLLYTDKPALLNILKFVKVTVDDNISDRALQGIFKKHITSKTNMDRFADLVEEFKTDKGKAKIELYSILKNKAKTSDIITKTPGGMYMYGDTEIGNSFESAAERISKESSLKDIKKELLLGDDD